MTDLAFLSGTDAEANLKKGQLAGMWLGRAEVHAILPNSSDRTKVAGIGSGGLFSCRADKHFLT